MPCPTNPKNPVNPGSDIIKAQAGEIKVEPQEGETHPMTRSDGDHFHGG